MAITSLSTVLSGVAGQYFVAAELSRQGFIATITLRNTQGIDILAADVLGKRTVGIQVKTNQASDREWILNKKAENLDGKDLFYVFVNLNGLSAPTFHVVEASHVANTIKKGHENWIAGTKKDGSARKDSSMRIFRDRSNTFLNAWGRLKLHSPQLPPDEEVADECP